MDSETQLAEQAFFLAKDLSLENSNNYETNQDIFKVAPYIGNANASNILLDNLYAVVDKILDKLLNPPPTPTPSTPVLEIKDVPPNESETSDKTENLPTHNDNSSEILPKDESNTSILNNETSDALLVIICHLCKKVFSQKETRLNHERHQRCSKHMNLTHVYNAKNVIKDKAEDIKEKKDKLNEQLRVLSCEFCGYETTKVKNRLAHMRHNHMNEWDPNKYGLKGEKRQYKCEECLYSTCNEMYFFKTRD